MAIVGLVVILTAMAWSETGNGPQHLETALAVGLVASALVYGCWWLAKSVARRTYRAFRQGYHDALALRGNWPARLGRKPAEAGRNAGRPEYRQAVLRGSARWAGRFVGSVRQAYRDGLEGDNAK